MCVLCPEACMFEITPIPKYYIITHTTQLDTMLWQWTTYLLSSTFEVRLWICLFKLCCEYSWKGQHSYLIYHLYKLQYATFHNECTNMIQQHLDVSHSRQSVETNNIWFGGGLPLLFALTFWPKFQSDQQVFQYQLSFIPLFKTTHWNKYWNKWSKYKRY